MPSIQDMIFWSIVIIVALGFLGLMDFKISKLEEQVEESKKNLQNVYDKQQAKDQWISERVGFPSIQAPFFDKIGQTDLDTLRKISLYKRLEALEMYLGAKPSMVKATPEKVNYVKDDATNKDNVSKKV